MKKSINSKMTKTKPTNQQKNLKTLQRTEYNSRSKIKKRHRWKKKNLRQKSKNKNTEKLKI